MIVCEVHTESVAGCLMWSIGGSQALKPGEDLVLNFAKRHKSIRSGRWPSPLHQSCIFSSGGLWFAHVRELLTIARGHFKAGGQRSLTSPAVNAEGELISSSADWPYNKLIREIKPLFPACPTLQWLTSPSKLAKMHGAREKFISTHLLFVFCCCSLNME